ncbi:MAG: hypothetical protein IPN38_03330 [Flavobacteriales bacterium]|nr:hypothetical protein [Flavobacteriales bacterium]
MRTQRPNTLFLFVLLLGMGAAQQAHAQPKTKVVLYKDRLAAAFDTVNCVKNVIKLNAFSFFRGEFPVYLERAITHDVSIELAAGITSRNYVSLSLSGDDVDDFSAGTEIKIGPTVHVGFRYYFADDLEPQGGYLHLDFAHLDYIKDIREKDALGELTDIRHRDTRTYNDIRLLGGYQLLSGTSNWLFDFYGGIGLRDRHMEVVHETLNITENKWTYDTEIIDDVVPAVFMGVKVGVGF